MHNTACEKVPLTDVIVQARVESQIDAEPRMLNRVAIDILWLPVRSKTNALRNWAVLVKGVTFSRFASLIFLRMFTFSRLSRAQSMLLPNEEPLMRHRLINGGEVEVDARIPQTWLF